MGILYRVTSPSGKSYIGITSKSLKVRWDAHVIFATGNSPHRNTALGAAIRKYGAASFKVETLVIGENRELSGLEAKAIAAFRTKRPNGYNMTDGGEGCSGLKQSDETKRKIGDALRGRKRPEHSRIMTGRKKTPEQRARMSAALRGVPHPKMRGKKLSPERIEALRIFFTGRKKTQAHCEAMSRARTGKPLSLEHREALKAAHRRRKSKLTEQQQEVGV